MNKTKLTAAQAEIVQTNNGLARYLRSLTEEVPHTPHSWLYEDQDSDTTLQNWMEILSTLQDGSTPEQLVFQFDTSQLKKWGPQGGHAPISELMEIVEEGFQEHSPFLEATTSQGRYRWRKALRSTIEFLHRKGIHDIRPASYESVIDDARSRDTLESNSGWPLFTKRSKDSVLRESIADARSGKWKEYPAIALFRTYNGKTRLVWMFPMSTNLVEASYYMPLYKALSSAGIDFFAPWVGFEKVRELITEFYDTSLYGSLAASDFTSTDAHFGKWAVKQVATVLKALYKPEYHAGLEESLLHMVQIPLVIGPNEQLTGWHGVASGSNWTNFVETIFDLILSYYVRFEQEARFIEPARQYIGLYAIGDDMSWYSYSWNNGFAELLEEAASHTGMVVKAEKTTNEEQWVKSLQRIFIRGYRRPDGLIRACYSTVRALNSLLHPERFHDPRLWSSDMFCIRCFMILENCVDHPLFEQFVRFVCAGSPHLVPFAKQSRSRIDQAFRESKLLPGLTPTYNQEKREARLSDFASIRIAANL